MSTRALVTFLHRLLTSGPDPVGPLGDATVLDRLVARPAPALQPLLAAHIDALLVGWTGGAALRPTTIPTTTLWLGAALNNLAWSAAHPGPRLLRLSLRLAQALPAADDLPAQIAYHSLLRHIERVTISPDWQPVARALLGRSPLTSAWLPRPDLPLDQGRLPALLAHAPLRVALRDRWLGLAPTAAEVRRGLSAERAAANAAVGQMLGQLLASAARWRSFVLSFYEAECALLRDDNAARPRWPLIEELRAARTGADPRQRRSAERAMTRYRPLVSLLADEAALRPYLYLDVRFLELIANA